ncbi:reverse transcriptase domain-containing protein [Tanacetum coccineum]
MLINCHGHNLSKGNIIKIFYHGLNKITQEVLNAASGGIFLYKTPNQAYQLLEDKVLLKLDWAKNQKSKPSFKKTVAFADEGSSNSDNDKIMARMDAMTMKMDAQYKDLQSRSKQPNPDHNDDDTPMSRKEEAKFMQTFRHLKTKLETTTKNHQASIQNLEAKFDRFADKQSGRHFGSLPSNTHPNTKGSSSKPYQPPQARNEHVNVVFTWSGKSYDPPINPNDQPNNSETPVIFDSEDEDEEPTPQPKPKDPKPHKLEQISAAFLSDESSALIQNKVPPKLRDLRSFLIPCNFNKDFSCDALADLGASINLMPYSLYAKLSLKTLKPTKISVRLADGSFKYHVGIAKNMLVEVGKLNFPVDFVILEMEEDKEDFNALIDEGHAGFYQRSIKDFSKIARPQTKLLEKDTPFEFNDECHKAFNSLKEKLTCTPVIVSPKWNLPFELMCDASDFAVGAILEFDKEIKDKKGTEKVVADHLSWIENDEMSDDSEVDDNFPGENLMEITTNDTSWFVDFANYLVGDVIPKGMTCCVSGPETRTILDQCHHGPTGGHYGPNTTAKKVLDSSFYWPTINKEAHTLVRLCEACQKTGNISKRDEMPLNSIQVT